VKIKTTAAAKELGIRPGHLHYLMRSGKLDPMPEQDSSKDYWWGPEDLERARAALATDLRRKEAASA